MNDDFSKSSYGATLGKSDPNNDAYMLSNSIFAVFDGVGISPGAHWASSKAAELLEEESASFHQVVKEKF